tara:strand:- start:798 stop:1049 length:252 start_codon:yes stop_codon:yes gene_type:complete
MRNWEREYDADFETAVEMIASDNATYNYELEFHEPLRQGKDVPSIEVHFDARTDADWIGEVAEKAGMWVEVRGSSVYLEPYGY